MVRLPAALKRSLPYRALRSVYHVRQGEGFKRLRQRLARNDRGRIAEYVAAAPVRKLHLGCGNNPLPGWLNSDYFPDDPELLHLDATADFPIADGTFDYVFSEHMIEHLDAAGGLNMLRESFRILRPGGRIRVATPSMEALIAIYREPERPLHRAYVDYHRPAWLDGQPLTTPAMVFNDFYRNWGHLCIYDEATLRLALEHAGFIDIEAQDIGKSGDPLLAGLENDGRMPQGLLALHTLTLEARKPGAA